MHTFLLLDFLILDIINELLLNYYLFVCVLKKPRLALNSLYNPGWSPTQDSFISDSFVLDNELLAIKD
jgi:hypothetical protein